MLLYSRVSWGIFLHLSFSATSAEMFNKHEDPFPAQSSGCFSVPIPTVQFKVFRGKEGKMGRKPRREKKLKELTKLNRHLI